MSIRAFFFIMAGTYFGSTQFRTKKSGIEFHKLEINLLLRRGFYILDLLNTNYTLLTSVLLNIVLEYCPKN